MKTLALNCLNNSSKEITKKTCSEENFTVITCSKLTIETLEQGVEYIQS